MRGPFRVVMMSSYLLTILGTWIFLMFLFYDTYLLLVTRTVFFNISNITLQLTFATLGVSKNMLS